MIRIIRYAKQSFIKRRLLLGQYVFFFIFVISAIIILYKLYLGYFEHNPIEYLTSNTYVYAPLQIFDKQVIKNENIEKLELLQKVNTDIVALIKIEGTNINYPVLQTQDNTYYLTYNYKKEKSQDGAIMLDKDCDLLKPSTNLLIYGHNNIGSNAMFSELIKYKSKSFYNSHKNIKLITNVEEAEYEIICVFLSQVYYKWQKEQFKYYFFIEAKNKNEFDNFITNCKKLSLYNIDSTAQYGDELITLSTCEYSRVNGRLAIVAKKIK